MRLGLLFNFNLVKFVVALMVTDLYTIPKNQVIVFFQVVAPGTVLTRQFLPVRAGGE